MHDKRHRIVLLLFTIVFIVIGVWVAQIINGTLPYADRWTRGLVDSLDHSYWYQAARFITELGSRSFIIPLLLVMSIVLLILFKDWFAAFMFAGGTIAAHTLNKLIKNLVDRERPSISVAANAEGYSFPSGHAMISMVCYGLLGYFLVKRMKSSKAIMATQLFFSLLVFLIGLSRYIINVHYLTDVMAGFVIGFICLIGIIYLYEWIQKYRSRS
ncbi:phosphatase PAP2 family protein [Oceanobacillus massiliensis]|uniref:phosphatase PAP2 family protein n=1 Tax=Oceanobacillus massiliensis TaxID=1465765 RepID=UPI00028867D4|nr:phosphatase PAP2 family protein [Oceanobacillus massiliensis]